MSEITRCSVLGRILSALFGLIPSRHASPMLVLSSANFVCGLATLFFWPFAHQRIHALSFCVIFGLCIGIILGLPESGVAYLIPMEFKKSLGAWTGMMRAVCAVFAVGGPLLSGLLVRHGGILVVGYLAGSSLLVSGALILLALWMREKAQKLVKRMSSSSTTSLIESCELAEVDIQRINSVAKSA